MNWGAELLSERLRITRDLRSRSKGIIRARNLTSRCSSGSLHRNPDMSGAVADFHIVLNSIASETVPELTDEWVKENSEGSETVEEYREEVRTALEEEQQAAVDSELASSVQNALIEKIEVKAYPEDAVNEQIAQLTDMYTTMAEMYGMDLGEFLESYMQMTEEDLMRR